MQINDDMHRIVHLLWEKEKERWERNGTPNNHIFISINNMKNYLVAERKREEKIKELMKP